MRIFDDRRRLAALASAEPTYPEQGATAREPPPGWYTHVRREVAIATGRAAFDKATKTLFTWQMHRSAGIAVTASHHTAEPGAIVVMRVGYGPATLMAPCRVVYCVRETNIQGFAYGTLPGHPEQGEEAFLLQLADDNGVRLIIRAFSRPASTLARLGGPLTRRVQNAVTERYVQALRRLVEPVDAEGPKFDH